LWIIIFGGVLGARGICWVAEMIPTWGCCGDVPGIRTRSADSKPRNSVLDNPSAGNLEELAELYFGAEEVCEGAGTAEPGDLRAKRFSARVLTWRAKAARGMGDLAEAIPVLEYIVGKDAKFDYYRATGLLGDGVCAHR